MISGGIKAVKELAVEQMTAARGSRQAWWWVQMSNHIVSHLETTERSSDFTDVISAKRASWKWGSNISQCAQTNTQNRTRTRFLKQNRRESWWSQKNSQETFK